MNVSIERRLRLIAARAEREDDEGAHHAEKKLWQKTLEAIAADGDPRAARALDSLKIDFCRWYA